MLPTNVRKSYYPWSRVSTEPKRTIEEGFQGWATSGKVNEFHHVNSYLLTRAASNDERPSPHSQGGKCAVID